MYYFLAIIYCIMSWLYTFGQPDKNSIFAASNLIFAGLMFLCGEIEHLRKK